MAAASKPMPAKTLSAIGPRDRKPSRSTGQGQPGPWVLSSWMPQRRQVDPCTPQSSRSTGLRQ